MNKTYSRRRYFIDKGYQSRIALKVILICTSGMVFGLALFNYLAYKKFDDLRWSIHISASSITEIIAVPLLYSSVAAVLLTVAGLLLFFRSMLKKTEGPIYRLIKDLQTAASGDLSINIWLRKEDDFKETALELNNMIGAVRKDFQQLRDSFAEINTTVNTLEYIMDRPELAKEKCRLLIASIEKLKGPSPGSE